MDISCVPNNEEKYISFSKKIKVGQYYDKKTKKFVNTLFEIRFLDTLGFMATSIEQLVKNISGECKNIEELRTALPATSEYFKNDEQFKLMTKKGVYPYDYIDNFEKMKDTKLPSITKIFIVIFIILNVL